MPARRENLLRINDKVDELELQVEPLRKQAETAKKYLHLRDELKSAEVSVWMETLDRLHAQAETVNHDYQTAKENLAGAQRELEQLYAASENIAQKMREKDLESERTREQISEAESAAAECESAAAVVRTNLQNSADSIARLRVEVSEQADRASALQAQIDAQQRRLQEIEAPKRRSTRSRSTPCSRTSSATPHPPARPSARTRSCSPGRARRVSAHWPSAARASRSWPINRRSCSIRKTPSLLPPRRRPSVWRRLGAGAGKTDRAAAGTVRLRRAAHAAERKNAAPFRL